MSLPDNVESEIKLSVASIPEVLERIAQAGFTVSRPEVFEQNDVLDTRDASLRASNCLLRIRLVGTECIITFKGPPQEGGTHKVREELEFAASDAEAAGLVFARLGFERMFRYEKYRTEFRAAGVPGVVTLDRTPIGNFLEVEADSATIDHVAEFLGFARSDYITASYGTLYREYCRRNYVSPADMVFDLLKKTL